MPRRRDIPAGPLRSSPSPIRFCLAIVAALALTAGHAVRAADLPPEEPATIAPEAFEERWSAAAGIYVWAAGLKGTAGVAGRRTVDFDATFGQILENLDVAVMAVGEVRYDRVGVFADLVYSSLSADATGPRGFVDASVTNQLTTATLMGQFRALESGKSSVDVMAGARLWNVSGDLTLTGPRGRSIRRDLDQTWVDPMVGVKGRLQGASAWYATGWGMIGGFDVSSEFAWDVLGAVGYEINDRFSLVAGYRALGVDYENDGFVFDVVQHGPLISGILKF